MKSLEQIKNEYAINRKFKSWENFCLVANDNMFVRAVDEIATLYANYLTQLILSRRHEPKPLVREIPLEAFG